MADLANNIKVKIMRNVEIPVLTRCCFCVPLRKGLITMAYFNLVLTGLVLPFFTYFMVTYEPKNTNESSVVNELGYLVPQLIIEFVALVIEMIMTIVFIVGLHMKKVVLMKSYLYFGIGYMLFCTVYNVVLAFVSRETANEFILVITQLMIHLYFLILVWSSIIKMSRDGAVKYTRSEEEA